MEKIVDNIEAIETAAQNALNSARDKANSIIIEGKKQANAILTSDLPLEDTRLECENIIIARAKENANRMVEEAKKSASQIQEDAGEQVKNAIGLIIEAITGVRS